MAALTDEPKAKPTIRINPRVSRAAFDGSIIPITEQLISVCCTLVFLGDLPLVFPSTAGTVLACLCAQEGFVAILAGSLRLLGSLGRAACSCGRLVVLDSESRVAGSHGVSAAPSSL